MTLNTPPGATTSARLSRRALDSLRSGSGPIMVTERGLSLRGED